MTSASQLTERQKMTEKEEKPCNNKSVWAVENLVMGIAMSGVSIPSNWDKMQAPGHNYSIF